MPSVALVGLIAGGHSGIPRYAVALGQALDRVAPEFPQLRLSLVTTRAGAEAVAPANLHLREVPVPRRGFDAGPGRIVGEQLVVAGQRADLLHFFDLSGPVLAPWQRFVTTIHDASVVHGLRGGQHVYKRRLWPWALRRARAAVAVSQFAKDEAVRHLGARPEKIAVVHSGPGLMTAGEGHANGRPAGKPFLLYVGNLTPIKNLPFLVRAFDRADVPAQLLLVGRPYQGSSELPDAIRHARTRDRIKIVCNADDAAIDGLYRSAKALVLPSRYEGFGFTPLEAMARGCPVLASDIPPLREVSGPGALLLPLDDEEAWARAIRRVVADERACAELRARGSQTVARYSWDDTARRLCRVFARAAA